VDFSGDNLLVRGVPGSGKTVVLLKRARRLSERLVDGRRPAVCIFTYNSALARYTNELMGRVRLRGFRVRTFHSWATATCCVVRNEPLVLLDDARRARLIQAALDDRRDQLPPGLLRRDIRSFWLPEFDWIKGRNIRTPDRYATVTRGGLGARLRRVDRRPVWDIFVEYNRRLFSSGSMDWHDPAPFLLDRFDDIPSRCLIDDILVDEAQDLTLAGLTLLRRVARRSLTIAADEAQKLYNTAFSWAEMGINIRGRASKRLQRTHRSTRQIIQLARSLSARPGESDETLPAAQGPKPVLHRRRSMLEERDLTIALIRALHRRYPDDIIGVIAVQNRCLAALQEHISGIPVETIRSGRGASWALTRPGVKLCTAHSAKGLEFDHVIFHRLNDGILPRYPPEELDDVGEFYMAARRLLYVAMTRGRLSLTITCSSPPSRFLRDLPRELYVPGTTPRSGP